MDDEITQAKNEILRKIKFYKQKQLTLPNFIRKTREEIIATREPKDLESLKSQYLKAKTKKQEESS